MNAPRDTGSRGDRGVATGLVAAGLLLVSGLAAAAVVVCLLQLVAHRVQGAADLVALTAAQARNQGTGLPCEAAIRAAESAEVRLDVCDSVGDELEFVVTVRVSGDTGRALLGVPFRAEATSHAGVTEGG